MTVADPARVTDDGTWRPEDESDELKKNEAAAGAGDEQDHKVSGFEQNPC